MKTPGPDHPITVTENPNRVRARFQNHVIADTARALTLQEADYPPVQYFPREDVEMAFFSRTDRSTNCPYKGDAAYYSLFVNGDLAENAIWTYEEPFPAVEAIRGHVAFYPHLVEVYEVEMDIQQRSTGMRTVNEEVEGSKDDRA